MATINITIKTDNAAFEYNAGAEFTRILRDLAYRIDNGDFEADFHSAIIRDVNGNSCGTLSVTDDDKDEADEVSAIDEIKNSDVYKQILADSFGGVMYNVDNHGKYDADRILYLWQQMTPADRESAGGIMKGAFNFLTER